MDAWTWAVVGFAIVTLALAQWEEKRSGLL